MGKKLLLVRHGQAKDPAPGAQDFSRALTEKGQNDAVRVAEKLLQKDIVPELLVSSNATRAWETSKLFAATWNMPVDSVQLLPEIYEATAEELLEVVRRLDDAYSFIALFGHNPGFTYLGEHFGGNNTPEMDTSGALFLEFEAADWVNVASEFVRPSLYIAPNNM